MASSRLGIRWVAGSLTYLSQEFERTVGTTIGSWVNKQLDLFKTARLIAHSGIFDKEWYHILYPDVARVGKIALWHYVRRGGIEGRKPHPLFEGGWYLSQNPDVVRSRMNPLAHYLLWGAAEGRDPNPFFDSDWYLRQYPDVAAANLNPLSHYILYGAAEGRDPSPHFDAHAYMREQLNGNSRFINPLSHFIQYGWGRAKRNVSKSPGHPKRQQISVKGLADNTTPADIPNRKLSADVLPTSMGSEDCISAGKAAWDTYGAGRLRQVIASPERLDIPQVSDPELSILLVLFNKAHLTLMCLEALIRNADVTYELIVVDNNSTDDTSQLLDHLDGAQILRNDSNVGFAIACMQAARVARGKYICFLNNDALLTPGSLSAAIRNFHRDPMVGAVGGKILFSDGRLQEAGCIVWSDASAWGLGRNADPDLPEFNFRRHVDYCSGAFLVTRRKLFEEIGGFDSIYHPAYYEDTDYCASLWSSGYVVVYEPLSVVAHYESASSEDEAKVKVFLAKNQEQFASKWKDYLRGQYFRLSENTLSARVSVRAPGARVLYITDCAISSQTSDREARAHKMLTGLVMLGHQVTCLTGDGCEDLSCILPTEIEVRELDRDGQDVIEYFRHFDVLWCIRPEAIRQLIQCGLHRSDSRPRIVYEITSSYEGREQVVAESWIPPVDQLLADAADMVLVSSQAQADALRRSGISNVTVLPTSANVLSGAAPSDQDRFLAALADIVKTP